MKTRITRRYLAGLLDGEGYFGILPGRKQSRAYFKPAIKMALTAKDAYILREICSLLGGHIERRDYDNPNWNTSYCWSCTTFVSVEKILKYVRPYLIIKKEQADILFEFLTTKQPLKNKNNLYFCAKIDRKVIEKRQRLSILLRKLNHRGRLPAETKQERPTDNAEGKVIVRTAKKSAEIDRNVNLPMELV